MVVARAETSTERHFPSINTITNPEFPAKIKDLTTRFKALAAQSQNAVVGRGNGCMTTLVKFGRRLVDELQLMDVALKHIKSGHAHISPLFRAEQMSPNFIITFLSQDNVPNAVKECVSAFYDAKESITNPQTRKSAEFKKGAEAYWDIQNTNDFLERAIKNLEEVVAKLSAVIPAISAETAQGVSATTDIHPAE